MIDKEFVLVSQGIEIMRTKSQENAINYVKKENDDCLDYKQKCIDNYEDYADNYIDLEIEYASEKEKDKEIERLNNIINGMEKFFKYADDNEVKPLNDTKISVWTICLDKLQELKGDSSNE